MRNIVFCELQVNETYDPTISINYVWDSIRVPKIVPLLNLATVLVPQVHLPRALAIYLSAAITILNAASNFPLKAS